MESHFPFVCIPVNTSSLSLSPYASLRSESPPSACSHSFGNPTSSLNLTPSHVLKFFGSVALVIFYFFYPSLIKRIRGRATCLRYSAKKDISLEESAIIDLFDLGTPVRVVPCIRSLCLTLHLMLQASWLHLHISHSVITLAASSTPSMSWPSLPLSSHPKYYGRRHADQVSQ
jgi:hypothetical protein